MTSATQYSITLSPEENDALSKIQAMTEYEGLELSKRKAMKVAILGYARTGNVKPSVKTSPSFPVAEVKSVGRPRTKLTEEERVEQAREVCRELGGTISGGACLYKKREMTAIGIAASYEVGIPLDQLNALAIGEQYYPDRETWEKKATEQGRI